MNRDEIIKKLNNEVLFATAFFKSLPGEKFITRSVPEKWSPAENVHHLMLSVRPLLLAFSLPKFILRLMFGQPNREGRSFEEVVEKYKGKLAGGAKASAPYIPRKLATDTDSAQVMELFVSTYSRFANRLASLNEADLDNYLLPHPILGKLTLREMLFFTVYHVSHHHELVRNRLTPA